MDLLYGFLSHMEAVDWEIFVFATWNGITHKITRLLSSDIIDEVILGLRVIFVEWAKDFIISHETSNRHWIIHVF